MKQIIRLNLILLITTLVACNSLNNQQSPDSSLSNLRLEVPCAYPKFNNDTECHWQASLMQSADPKWKLKQEIIRTFGGNPNSLYAVTFHVRGVVEPKNFTGGKVEHEHFQMDGVPVQNDYNFYSLKVSAPLATYTFNRNEETVGHYTFPIDYEVTIMIKGGAQVVMGAYDSNDVAIANNEKHVVKGIAPAPAAFDGQFFQLDVVSIALVK